MNDTGETAVRLGRISYLNVLPIYYPIESGNVRGPLSVVSAPPAELNLLARAGKLDVSACSSFEYASAADDYFLVPDLAIGSRGHVRSVLLLSRLPVAKLDGKSVRVSYQTHTSVALLKLFLQQRVGVDVTYTTGDVTRALASGERPDAFLAIGDEAMRLSAHPDYPHRWDLGSVWLDWTALPFIFGVWIARRAAAAENPGPVREACRALVEAKDWSKARPELVAELAAAQGGFTVPDMRTYFEGLVYDFGEREKDGLSVFFEKLEGARIIPKAPKLQFLEM
ncbi:protein of unknown function DUF178 [Desulfovibrio sp. X2]|uniref:menaquinone biosynthetic enzyme MqnA/MqnD family protein n=1 Tax=Desulfovibrio sp. X2 TaxID=941449 RepID=UPI000358EC53|nr:menaquinone biosynthesis protein [Desulfovibrio sp. X2]EPR43579.1 protein of unknown function DUF178 [Desulfovibrio sp. X2]